MYLDVKSVTKELFWKHWSKKLITRFSKIRKCNSEKCLLLESSIIFVYAILLTILDFYPNLSPTIQLQTVQFSLPCLWSSNCISALDVPLSLLCTSRCLTHNTKTDSDFIFSAPEFLQGASIFLSLVFQMGYVYNINGPVLIVVYLAL